MTTEWKNPLPFPVCSNKTTVNFDATGDNTKPITTQAQVGTDSFIICLVIKPESRSPQTSRQEVEYLISSFMETVRASVFADA